MKAVQREVRSDPEDESARFEELRDACVRTALLHPAVEFRDEAAGGFALEQASDGDVAVLLLVPRSPNAHLFRRWRGEPGAEMFGLPVDLAHGFDLCGENLPSAESAAAVLLRQLREHATDRPQR